MLNWSSRCVCTQFCKRTQASLSNTIRHFDSRVYCKSKQSTRSLILLHQDVGCWACQQTCRHSNRTRSPQTSAESRAVMCKVSKQKALKETKCSKRECILLGYLTLLSDVNYSACMMNPSRTCLSGFLKCLQRRKLNLVLAS